jgi:K+-sensing histidine kinase KdpD
MALVESGNVTIAVPGDPELARAVLTHGRRIARHLGVEWIAVRIVTNGETSRDLQDIVNAFGGLLLCAKATDIARALIDLSCREHTRVLVLGRSRRPRFWRRLRRGTTERILRAKRPFDVVIAGEGADR